MAKPTTTKIQISDGPSLHKALLSPHPILIHLNADTTWLLQLPYPSSGNDENSRLRYNILLDPWLTGPQSDVASWFSTQWHVVAPSVSSLAELDGLLRDAEAAALKNGGGATEGGSAAAAVFQGDEKEQGRKTSYIDAVIISHEFTDHCHEATLRQLDPETPILATDKAAGIVRGWGHFGRVVDVPGISFGSTSSNNWRDMLLGTGQVLPDWIGVGRVVTGGDSLYYHSAVVVAFLLSSTSPEGEEGGKGQAVVYSPHGIRGEDLAGLGASRSTENKSDAADKLETLALLHGLHDVRIWPAIRQLNLGARNGGEAAKSSKARYWVATHDEVKKGGGFIAPLLRRIAYGREDAEGFKGEKECEFVELGSGDGLVLEG